MKKIIPYVKKGCIVFKIKSGDIGFIPEKIWCYSKRFVTSFAQTPTTCEILENDLRKISSIWKRYSDKLKKG